MSRKNIWDIYSRNVTGFFREGFPDPGIWTLAWLPAAVVFVVTLPLTLSLVVGLKSLIDFFSRKEILEEKMSSLNTKIEQSGEAEIESLVKDISTYKAQSISSNKLIQTLQATSTATNQAITGSLQAKKRALQEEQFNSEGNSDSVENRETAISIVKLNPTHQRELDAYSNSNSAHCNSQKLQKQKDVIKDYLGADHNSGKRMQHIIYDHFFFKPAPVEIKNATPSDRPITALPINQ